MRMGFKKIIFCLSIAAVFCTTAIAAPSQQAQTKVNPVEKIQEESEGNVIIDIPDNILHELMKEAPEKRQGGDNLKRGINKIDGFRIQVFSDGTNQHSLAARAKARGNAITARFPKYRGQVYSFSSSPNWYTRIGNFRTQQEAAEALSELKSAFPQYAGEMRIVKSQIVVIK